MPRYSAQYIMASMAPRRLESRLTPPKMGEYTGAATGEGEFMTITQLGYLGLGVGDIAEWEEFASEVLGMMVSKSSDGSTTYLRMDDYHHRFILHPDAADDVAYLGWQAPTKSAFDDVHSNLKDAGVTVRAATSEELASRKVMDMIAFEDPDGARTEVFHGALVQPDTAFRSPRPIKGFVTGSMGLGHIVLNVNDLEKATAFYRDVLGLRISDFVEINRPDRQLKMSFFPLQPQTSFPGAGRKGCGSARTKNIPFHDRGAVAG